MSLLDVIIDLKRHSSETDSQVGKLTIPLSAKRKFTEIWKNETRNAILIDGQIRISNQGPPTYAVTDELLLKCAKAVELYKEYDRLADLLLLHITDRNTLNKIGAEKNDSSLSSTEIEAVKSQLETKPELAGDISVLKMMLEAKSARSEDGHVGPFKQITRMQDRWAPALSKFIATLAADAYPNSITTLLMNHPELTREISESLKEEIESGDLKFLIMPSSESLSRNLVLSILTKPFVILTGASGTGKTKLAESVARYFANSDSSNFKIVPVGADWTDNRHVLGFVNHLRDDGTDGKRPIYQTTDILDLLLEASENKDVPYFLILDEMNLSHVERYFADFLSVMERSGGMISLHKEGSGDNSESRLLRHPDDKLGVPQAIDYPQNLFVIGTVNIDETTYMFSPKVLDRANVIEFKVGAEAIENYLQNPTGYPEMKRADEGVAVNFLQLSLNARTNALSDLDEKLKTSLNLHLLEIFGIMEKGRYEFAYRTLNEVIRYLRVCHELAEDKNIWIDAAWKADLDAQILQKILPKLHGSIGRISDLIVNLADYCHRGALPSENAIGVTKLKDVAGLDASTAIFSQSFKKLQTMASTLQAEQFVSFIR